MKKLELKDTLNILSKEEFERLGGFVNSPFSNITSRVKHLYNFIAENYKEVCNGNLSRELIASEILMTSRKSDNVRKLFSDFNKTVEDYLELLEYESDNNYKKTALLKQNRIRNNIDRFEYKLKELQKELAKMDPDAETYKLAFESVKQKRLSEPETDFHVYSSALQLESDCLDAFYFSSKLFLFQLMFSKQNLNKEPLNYKWEMWEEIDGYLRKNIGVIKNKYPDIYLRYTMLKMLDFKNDNLIEEYKNYLTDHSDSLSPKTLTEYYTDLYNYLTLRIEKGEFKFRKTLFELVKQLNEKNLLYDSGKEKISYYSFKQICDTAIFLKELDWVEFFIKKYANHIDYIDRKNVVNLAFAKLYYYKGEIQESRIYLAKVDYKDYIHYLDAKLFLLSIEYEEENYIEIELITDSVNKYIKSHPKIPQHLIDNTKRFLYYLKEIAHINENKISDNFNINKLIGELEADKKPVYARNWLKEKLNSLKK